MFRFRSLAQGTAFLVGCLLLIRLIDNIVLVLFTHGVNAQKGEAKASVVVGTSLSEILAFILLLSLIIYSVFKKRRL